MKISNRIIAAGLLALLAVPVFADDANTSAQGTSVDRPDRGDVVNARLDAKGDRINARLDARAANQADKGHYRNAARLDAKGNRIDRHLDRVGNRIDRRVDRRRGN